VREILLKLIVAEPAEQAEGNPMVLISAHQGGSEDARPATYEAYKAAPASGAEYAELDIRKTRDGTLVVYHDARAGRAGPNLAGLTHGQLCDRLEYQVPRVDEVMGLLAGRMRGHLDLKETGYEDEVIKLALETFGPGNFVVTTLEDASIARIKQMFPDVRAALSIGRDLAGVPWRHWARIRREELFPLPRVRSCRADWVAANHTLARFGVIAQARRNGIGVMVWTVNSGRLIDHFLADSRINVLVTDRPRRAVSRRAVLSRPAARSGRPGRP
jgi:glycerophosphoryl diester phosphodiesterase